MTPVRGSVRGGRCVAAGSGAVARTEE